MNEQGKWKMKGHDTFEGEDYPLPGEFDDEPAAVQGALAYLAELEETQPSKSSGGQSSEGIQDRVFIVSPDGKERRIFLPTNE